MLGSLLLLGWQIRIWVSTAGWQPLSLETVWLWSGWPLATGLTRGILTPCLKQETGLVLFLIGAAPFLVGSLSLLGGRPLERTSGLSLDPPVLDEATQATVERVQAHWDRLERSPSR
jgi:hypothetical protein